MDGYKQITAEQRVLWFELNFLIVFSFRNMFKDIYQEGPLLVYRKKGKFGGVLAEEFYVTNSFYYQKHCLLKDIL